MADDQSSVPGVKRFPPQTILNLNIDYERSDEESGSEQSDAEPTHEDIQSAFFQLLRCPHEFFDFDEAHLALALMLSITSDGDEGVPLIYEIYDNFCQLREKPSKALESPYYVPFIVRDNEKDELSKHMMLAEGHQAQYRTGGRVSDLSRAIGCMERAIELSDEDDPDLSGRHATLGNLQREQYERLGDTQYLADAIYSLEQAVSLAHAAYPELYSNLGYSLLRRFQKFGEMEDLDDAIKYQEKAAFAVAHGPERAHHWVNSLGDALQLRYEYLGRQTDINRAIDLCYELLELDHDLDVRSTILNNLGSALQKRFKHAKNGNDINRAIEHQEEAVSLTPETHIHKPLYLTNLGNSLQLRFERLGAVTDVDLAISYQEHALRLLSRAHQLKSSILNDLGNSLRLRFSWSGQSSDINQAIARLSESMELTDTTDAERPRWLNSLGNALRQRFETIGDLLDIDTAITRLAEAVSCSTEGHVDKPERLNHLGNAYMSRFERLRESTDVEQAVKFCREAVLLSSRGGSGDIALLADLGGSLNYKFRYSHDLSDSDEAIAYQEEAVNRCPPENSSMPLLFYNLGGFYKDRYMYTHRLSDLDDTISCLEKAIALTPDGHAGKAACYHNLAQSLELKFRKSEERDDINRAVQYHTLALDLTSGDHVDRAHFLYDLAVSLVLSAGRTQADQAVDLFRQAALSPLGTPIIRFQAAQKWATLANLHDHSSTTAFRTALDLIPQVVWLGTDIDRRYEEVSSIGKFITRAVAHAISVQEYDLALEWLEEGRSIVWRQMLQLRTPMDDLRSIDPTRANQLEQIARALDRASSPGQMKGNSPLAGNSLERDSQARRRLAEQWQGLVDQVRELPGLSGFLRSRRASELVKAAKGDHVVAINVHEGRCDALVVAPGAKHVSCTPLPNMSYEKAANAQRSLMRSLQLSGVRFRAERRPLKRSAPLPVDRLEDVLEFLWTDVAQPILAGLHFLDVPPDAELPRITWCPTGPLAFLPLHAAGSYKQPLPHGRLFNHAVSSYTPTVGGLISSPPSLSEFSGILAIGQASTAGQSGLPGTIDELTSITKNAGSLRVTQLIDHAATPHAVLESINTHSWVHFACHASQSLGRPTESAFYLHDGTLDLATITKRSLGRKAFAFLSACQTATGDENLPEEAVHLAAGMIMAGYPTVVATMWSIQDNDAPLIAEYTYSEMLSGGQADSRRSARALHKAVGRLRDKVGGSGFFVLGTIHTYRYLSV